VDYRIVRGIADRHDSSGYARRLAFSAKAGAGGQRQHAFAAGLIVLLIINHCLFARDSAICADWSASRSREIAHEPYLVDVNPTGRCSFHASKV
jgi:hypothetical protein